MAKKRNKHFENLLTTKVAILTARLVVELDQRAVKHLAQLWIIQKQQ